MTPSLREIQKQIISAIRGIEGLKPAEVVTFVFKARDACVSLESAQDLIDDLQLPVIIGEDLAQAIQAEKEIEHVVDPAQAQVAGNEEIWDTAVPPEDYRLPFDYRYEVSDVLTSKQVEKLRKEEAAKIDSASLRPYTTQMKMIESASREDTARLFAQDKIYRSHGGLRPLFDFISEKGKKTVTF